MTPEISLILPAYNEARVIPVTIGEAVRYFESRGLRYQIIVAADGTDGTREIVRKMAATNPALQATGADARRGKGPRHPRGRGRRYRHDHRLCRRRQQGADRRFRQVPSGAGRRRGYGDRHRGAAAPPLNAPSRSTGASGPWDSTSSCRPWSASAAFRTRSAGSSSSSTPWPRSCSAARRSTATCSTWRFWRSRGAWATGSSRCRSAGATTPTAASTW